MTIAQQFASMSLFEKLQSGIGSAIVILLVVIAYGLYFPGDHRPQDVEWYQAMKRELPRKFVRGTSPMENGWYVITLEDKTQYLYNLRNGALAPIASDHIFFEMPASKN